MLPVPLNGSSTVLDELPVELVLFCLSPLVAELLLDVL